MAKQQDVVRVYDALMVLAVRGSDDPIVSLLGGAEDMEYDIFVGSDFDSTVDRAIAAGYPRGSVVRIYAEAPEQKKLGDGSGEREG